MRASQHAIAGHVGAQTTLFNRLTLTAAVREEFVRQTGIKAFNIADLVGAVRVGGWDQAP
ncbi:MAG TPA: hypothetical protein VL356_14130 [Acidocella sp.]|nr:hypothetical protein [Acidocella sp.]